MRHQTRIQLSFGLVVSLFFLVLLAQLLFMRDFSVQVRDLLESKLRVQDSLQAARSATLRIRAEVWDSLLYPPAVRQTAIAGLDRQAAGFYQARRSLSGILYPSGAGAIYDLDLAFRIYYLFAKDVLALSDLRAFTSNRDYAATFQRNQDRLEQVLDTLTGTVQADLRNATRTIEGNLRFITLVSLVLPGLAIILAAALSILLPRRITRPLRMLEALTRSAADGDYRLRADFIDTRRTDQEIRALGQSFNHLLAEIQAYRERMEELVMDRTRALEESNEELQATVESLKETQEHLIQSEKMAALGPLVAGVAHEVNTPIGNSITASSFLENQVRKFRREFDSGDLRKSSLEDFLSSTTETSRILTANLQRAGELITSFKRVAVDQQSSERRQFDLRSYVNETVISHQPLLRNTGYSIANRINPDIAMDTNPGALSQIISNLIINSLRHGFRGRSEGGITIDGHREGSDVLVDYRDDGHGIPREIRHNIFDPFFTTMRNQGGSGLGMYIAFTLASGSLGGRLELADAEQPGVHFRLRIPCVLPKES